MLHQCLPVPVKRIVPLEGQRPRLTQNSTTAARNRSQTPPPPKPLDPPAAHAQINDFAVHDFATPPRDAGEERDLASGVTTGWCSVDRLGNYFLNQSLWVPLLSR